MKKNDIITALVAVVLTVALIVGVSSAAGAANYGSEEDPLISLSYLESVFVPEMLTKIEQTFQGLEERYYAMFDTRLSQYTQQVQEMLTAPAAGPDEVFTIVTLTRGQKLTATAGTELLIRSGSAVSYGEGDTLLSDLTSGTVIGEMGAALSQNHMYVVTTTGTGVYASGDEVRLLVRGEYTIS